MIKVSLKGLNFKGCAEVVRSSVVQAKEVCIAEHSLNELDWNAMVTLLNRYGMTVAFDYITKLPVAK